MSRRDETRKISVRGLEIGGGAKVSVQSMCNTKTWDVEATLAQIRAFQAVGCDIVRLAIPDEKSALALEKIREGTDMPLVADIHFDYRLALMAAERGIDKIRINPGNIGSEERVKAVADACRSRGIPIRIGVNAGSLEKRLIEKYGHPCPEAMVESARDHAQMLERCGFEDICLSLKTSSVPLTVETYRLAAETFDYPLHLGVTETGTEYNGTIQSAVGIGTLLMEGIGDTIRVSLTNKPEKEVKVGLEILRSLGMRPAGPSITSCPTCGRTKVDLVRIASQVEDALEILYRDRQQSPVPFPRVAVMGCAVNGPGEAKGADVALCGGDGEFLLFVRGKQVCKVREEDAVGKVVEHVVSLR